MKLRTVIIVTLAAIMLAACGATTTTSHHAKPSPATSLKLKPVLFPSTVDQLEGISCSSSSYCLVAGGMGASAEFCSGSTVSLKQVPGPLFSTHKGPITADAVSCLGSNTCIVGGTVGGVPFTARYTNYQWSIPTLLTHTNLASVSFSVSAISCVTNQRCLLAGTATFLKTGEQEAVILSTSNAIAKATTLPPTKGFVSSTIYALGCYAAGLCIATGTYTTESGVAYPLVASNNGAANHWSVITNIPSTSGPGDLNDVSCTTSGNCVLVGYKVDGAGGYEGLVLSRINGHWTAKSMHDPSGGNDLAFESVSCLASSCYIGGSRDFTGTVYGYLLANLSLTEQSLPFPTRSSTINSAYPESIWCNSATCIGVGQVNNTTKSKELNLAIGLVAGKWENLSIASATHNSLASGVGSIACSNNLVDCAMVTTAYDTGELLIHQHGSQYRQVLPGNDYQDIACMSSQQCVATGSQGNSPLIDAFSLANPSVTATPVALHTSNGGALYSVACPTANACFAVGGKYYNFTLNTGNQADLDTPYVVELTKNALSEPIVMNVASPLSGISANSSLDLIACQTKQTCYEVGTDNQYGQAANKTFIAMLKGNSWTMGPSIPVSPRTTYQNPTAFSCNVSSCFLAETPSTPAGVTTLKVLRFKAGRWSSVSLPAGLLIQGHGISISSAGCDISRCMIVGSRLDRFGQSEPLVITIQGKIVKTELLKSVMSPGSDGTASGVYCTSNSCLVDGYTNPPGELTYPWLASLVG